MDILKYKWHNFPIYILLIFLLGLIIRLALVIDPNHLSPLFDDSYYSLSVARNIASGNGITYSGIQTNGFQPLYVFICVPYYYFFGENAIYLALISLAVINTVTGLFIYRLLIYLRCRFGAILGIIIWSLSPYIYWNGTNGLETAFTSFFLVTSAYYYIIRVRKNKNPNFLYLLHLGALLGFGLLARIDMGFWALAIAIDVVLINKVASFIQRVKQIIIIATVSFILYSPWLLYNLIIFKSILPTSGSGVRFHKPCFWLQLLDLRPVFPN